MSFPDFFIVGAAKSGTTSIWNYLKQHPRLISTQTIRTKELGYFSNLYGTNDEEYYKSLFIKKDPNQLSFEVCTSYLTSPESPVIIKEKCPDAKIIIILRNPVERAFSLYKWMVANGYEYSSNFGKALNKEKSRENSSHFRKRNLQYFYNYMYVGSGFYYAQVKRYIDLFGRDKVKVLIFEDLKRDAQNELRELCDFLDIDHINFDTREEHNTSKFAISPLFNFIVLRFIFGIFRLFKLYGIVHWLTAINTRLNSSAKTRLPEELRSLLRKTYTKDIKRLEELIQKPVSGIWLNN